jgi:hypothetical protein
MESINDDVSAFVSRQASSATAKLAEHFPPLQENRRRELTDPLRRYVRLAQSRVLKMVKEKVPTEALNYEDESDGRPTFEEIKKRRKYGKHTCDKADSVRKSDIEKKESVRVTWTIYKSKYLNREAEKPW